MCPMSPIQQREREMKEYPYIQQLFLKAFDKLYQQVYQYRECSWSSGLDIFNWWLYGNPKLNPKSEEDELTLFFEE